MIDFHSQLSIIPQVYNTAELQDNLEHSGGITITWNSATDTEIPMGAYVTYRGIRYVLLEPYAPSRAGVTHYQYDPTFRHPQNMLDRIPFWVKSRDAESNPVNLQTTSFTGYPHTIVQKVVDFINTEYYDETGDTFFRQTVGTGWTFSIPRTVIDGIVQPSNVIITVGFDGCSIKSAANAIGDAMGCNVFWDWSTKTIRFVVGTTIQGEAYNCFHVLGGTTNMGKSTMSGGFAAVTQRMPLREPQKEEGGETVPADSEEIIINGKIYHLLKGSIISGADDGGIRLTTDLIFDEIYPKQELYVNSARQRLCYLTDENGDFIVDDASLGTYKTFAKWYLTFKYADGTPYTFEQSLLIEDQPLGLLFQIDFEQPDDMSPLVGQQFEMTYYPQQETEIDKTDVDPNGFTVAAGEFYVSVKAIGNTLLPGESKILDETETGLVPRVGDKVTLVNMKLDDTQKAKAKQELMDAAKEIIGAMTTPAGEYSESVTFADKVDGVQPPHTIARVGIGEASPFGNTHGPVVTAISQNLDTDIAEVTVGSWSRKTKTGGTVDKLDTVNVSTGSGTTGGTTFSDGVIGEGGGYTPGGGGSSAKEQETINQTQPKADTLFMASLSSVISSVASTTGNVAKADTDIFTMVSAFYGTRDVTDKCHVKLTSTTGIPEGVTFFIGTGATVALTQTALTTTAQAMTSTKRWIRIHVAQGTAIGAKFDVPLTVTHPLFTDRNLTFVVDAQPEGQQGQAGGNTATVYLYRRMAEAPQSWSNLMPTGKMWYKFADKKLYTYSEGTYTEVQDGAAILNGWHLAIPGDTTDPIYITAAIAYSNSQYDDIDTNEWVTPVQYTENGEDGAHGISSAIVFLYRRYAPTTQNPTPAKPQLTMWYKFEDGKLYTRSGSAEPYTYTEILDGASILNGWHRDIPDANGDPCFVIQSAALGTGDYDAIEVDSTATPAKDDWSGVRKLVEDGKSAVVLDLDNQHEDFLYNDAGTRLSAQVTSLAHLYDGGTEKTENITWHVCCNVGAQSETWTPASDEFTEGTVAKAKISTGGRLTIDQIYVNTAKVKVRATYNNHYYYAEFTGNRNSQDKYDLIFDPNAVTYNPATFTGQNITISAKRQDLESGITELTFGDYDNKSMISNNATKGYLRLFVTYSILVGQQWVRMPQRVVSSPFNLTNDIAGRDEDVYFQLRRYDDCETLDDRGMLGSLVDYETIPIAKVTNGRGGADGNDAAVAFATPDKVSIQCDTNGNVLNSTEITVTFSLKAGTTSATVSSVTVPSSLPTGVEITEVQTDVYRINVYTTASASGISDGLTFTINGYTDTGESRKDYSAPVTVSFIGALQGEFGNDSAVAYASPDKITIQCDSQGNVILGQQTEIQKNVTFSMVVGDGSETVTVTGVRLISSLPTGVTIFSPPVDNVKQIVITTPATAGSMVDGLTFTVTGTVGTGSSQKTYSAPVSVALIGATHGVDGTRFQRIYRSLNIYPYNSTQYPNPSGNNVPPSDWSIAPTEITSSQRYRYVSDGTSTDGGSTWSWSEPKLDAYFPEDGRSISIKGTAVCVVTDDNIDVDGYSALQLQQAGLIDDASIVEYDDHVLYNNDTQSDSAFYSKYLDEFEDDISQTGENDGYIMRQTGHLWIRNSASASVRWTDVGQIKGDQGPKGDDGLQGCVVRVSEWVEGSTYRNDDGNANVTIGYIDVAACETTDTQTYPEGYKFFQVKKSDTAGSSRIIVNSTTRPDSDLTHENWEELTSVGPIFTSLLIAKNAYIKFGTGNKFLITDSNNKIQAGMKGDGDIRLWAGGTNISDANDTTLASVPFRVEKDGKVNMTNASVEGDVKASKTSSGGLITSMQLKPGLSSAELVGKVGDNEVINLGFDGTTGHLKMSSRNGLNYTEITNSEYGGSQRNGIRLTIASNTRMFIGMSGGKFVMRGTTADTQQGRSDIWLGPNNSNVGDVYVDSNGFLRLKMS